MEIKNLKKTAKRILEAIKNKEEIILYADSDLDGVASAVILKETIKSLGGEISRVYFPDREKEGYGLSKKALKFLVKFLFLKTKRKKTKALLILMDCGIGNIEEIKLANKLGFRVILIDHHEAKNKLPEAEIIVDPKQPGDKYPFKELANAGIIFKLSEEIFGKKMSNQLRNNFSEIAALATISDMMPQIKDNKILIEKGLNSFKRTFRPSFKVFQKVIAEEKPDYQLTREVAQVIISALNAATIKNHINEAYDFLITNDERLAKILVKNLIERNSKKQSRIKEITREIDLLISKRKEDIVVFEGEESWEMAFLGAVASRICQKFKKPTFIYRKKKKESRGAVRTPDGINGVEAMKSCSDLLKGFGGHPLAAGFNIQNKNLEKFKNCLIKYFK